MKIWKFVTPRLLGFSIRTASQFAVDKFRGAPTRPVQVAQYVARNARAGDPKDVLRTIDRFAREERWLMNIGPDKGPLIQELAERLPNDARILELGAYCGYSSIMFASRFGETSRVVSIEIDENAVRASRTNVEFAGLANQITFIHGPSTKMIPSLDGRFDLVFLDHRKELYKQDLQLIEQRGLIGPGTIVVADNVGDVFDPHEYLAYVRTCGRYESEYREATIEYTDLPDGVEISLWG